MVSRIFLGKRGQGCEGPSGLGHHHSCNRAGACWPQALPVAACYLQKGPQGCAAGHSCAASCCSAAPLPGDFPSPSIASLAAPIISTHLRSAGSTDASPSCWVGCTAGLGSCFPLIAEWMVHPSTLSVPGSLCLWVQLWRRFIGPLFGLLSISTVWKGPLASAILDGLGRPSHRLSAAPTGIQLFGRLSSVRRSSPWGCISFTLSPAPLTCTLGSER